MDKSPFKVRFNAAIVNIASDTEMAITELEDDIARKCGVEEEEVQRWKRGEAVPDANTLFRLCMAYGISADFLLGMCGESETTPVIGIVRNLETEKPHAMPPGYDANIMFLNQLLIDEGKKHDANERPTSAFEAAAKLPEDIRDGVFSLIRYEHSIFIACAQRDIEYEDNEYEEEEYEDLTDPFDEGYDDGYSDSIDDYDEDDIEDAECIGTVINLNILGGEPFAEEDNNACSEPRKPAKNEPKKSFFEKLAKKRDKNATK